MLFVKHCHTLSIQELKVCNLHTFFFLFFFDINSERNNLVKELKIKMSDIFYIKHSSIQVPDYELGDCPDLERILSVWDDVYFVARPIGLDYDENTKILYVPRGFDIQFLEKLLNRRAETDYNHYPAEKAMIRLNTEPKNSVQQKSIAFLLGEGKFTHTARASQLSLNLQTGDGKTYCVIAGLSFMRTKALILTHADSIKQQWIDSLTRMTNLNEIEIFNVRGSKDIDKILKIEKKLPWKIFVVNRRSLQSYAKKNGWEAVGEFIKKLEVGVKVFDEAHLEFATMMKIDFHSNVKKTIYLTANLERSEHKENRVFSHVFKNVPTYGVKQGAIAQERHVLYVPFYFNSNPVLEERMSVRGLKGWFDKNKYNDIILNNGKLEELVKYLVKTFYQKGHKLLITTSKIESTEFVAEVIRNNFPEYTVGLYNSKIPADEKEKTLACDIISSTPKSLGTGNDIPMLRYIFNFEVYSSSVQANQLSGRLRPLPDGKKTLLIEPIDLGFKDIERMYKKRRPVFKKKCLSVKKIEYKG